MAEARVRFDEDARWDAFQRRSDDWFAVNRHRAFLAAAREALGGYQGQARGDIVARSTSRSADSTSSTRPGDVERILPKVPDPKPDDRRSISTDGAPTDLIRRPGSGSWSGGVRRQERRVWIRTRIE